MSAKEIKIADYPELVKRDGIIVSKNNEGYQAFIESRRRAIQSKDRTERLEETVETLTSEICEVKAMLKQLLEMKNGKE